MEHDELQNVPNDMLRGRVANLPYLQNTMDGAIREYDFRKICHAANLLGGSVRPPFGFGYVVHPFEARVVGEVMRLHNAGESVLDIVRIKLPGRNAKPLSGRVIRAIIEREAAVKRELSG